MKRIKRTIILLILTCLTALSLSGCKNCSYQGYAGKYPALYTEAIYSILGVHGYYDSVTIADPAVEILETDEYGRVMYCYLESGKFAILIAQKTDADYVYYYPDFNFILTSDCNKEWEIYTHTENISEYVKNYFSAEEINQLKELNDFGKEINESNCIKTSITLKKQSPRLSKNTIANVEALCKEYAKEAGCKGKDNVYRYDILCTYDNYGRMLYYVWGVDRVVKGEGISSDSEFMSFDLAIIFNPDWSVNETNSVLGLKDNYQNDLKKFKEFHNWNQPL